MCTPSLSHFLSLFLAVVELIVLLKHLLTTIYAFRNGCLELKGDHLQSKQRGQKLSLWTFINVGLCLLPMWILGQIVVVLIVFIHCIVFAFGSVCVAATNPTHLYQPESLAQIKRTHSINRRLPSHFAPHSIESSACVSNKNKQRPGEPNDHLAITTDLCAFIVRSVVWAAGLRACGMLASQFDWLESAHGLTLDCATRSNAYSLEVIMRDLEMNWFLVDFVCECLVFRMECLLCVIPLLRPIFPTLLTNYPNRCARNINPKCGEMDETKSCPINFGCYLCECELVVWGVLVIHTGLYCKAVTYAWTACSMSRAATKAAAKLM